MPTIIRFPDGTEAKLVHPDGTWECADEDMQEILRLRTELLDYAYYPNPFAGIAEKIAAEVGAEVIEVDPWPTPADDPPDMDY